MTACACGHSIEEHPHDPKFPGSTACSECDCIAYEAAENAPAQEARPARGRPWWRP